MARGRRNGTLGAALFIDLDEFKNVNDTLGHAAGDRLVQSVAARLSATLRDVDTLGRMGGDEFVVLIEDSSSEGAAELVAERILDVMRQPFDLVGAADSIRGAMGLMGGIFAPDHYHRWPKIDRRDRRISIDLHPPAATVAQAGTP